MLKYHLLLLACYQVALEDIFDQLNSDLLISRKIQIILQEKKPFNSLRIKKQCILERYRYNK